MHRKRQRRLSPSQATAAVDSALIGVGEIVDVEDVEGIRVLIGDDNRPMIEYLVKWKVSPANASLRLTTCQCRIYFLIFAKSL